MRPLLTWLTGLTTAAGLALAQQPAWGACTPNVSPLTFDPYDVFAASPTEGTAIITLTCGAGDSYTITLFGSNSDSGGMRHWLLNDSQEKLYYSLYTTQWSTVWTDATQVSGNTGIAQRVQIPIYGRIPSGQNARVGAYADQITVTLSY